MQATESDVSALYRAEIRRVSENKTEEANTIGSEERQALMLQLGKLQAENKTLREFQQSAEARSIGLQDTVARTQRSPTNATRTAPLANTSDSGKDANSPLPMSSVNSPTAPSKTGSPPESTTFPAGIASRRSPPELPPVSAPVAAGFTGSPTAMQLSQNRAPQPLSASTAEDWVPAKIEIDLDMPWDEVTQDEEAFIFQMRIDLADALMNGDKNKIRVQELRIGGKNSVVATVQIDPGVCADGITPLEKARSLAKQAVDPHSVLRRGVLTSFTTAAHGIVLVEEDRVTPSVVLEVRVGHCRNIPQRDNGSGPETFVVVHVNDADLGITEKHVGCTPNFDQVFKGQVMVQKGTMISLSFHQQTAKGKDQMLGYVAVPLQRVIESSSEEGWYDLRSSTDGLVQVSESMTAAPQRSPN